MALRNAVKPNKPSTTDSPLVSGLPKGVETNPVEPPTFETDEAPANDPVAVTESPTTSLATAPAANTALSMPLSTGTTLKALQNVIGATDLESLGIGVFPRITVGLDGFSIDKTKELGKKIKFEVLSWNFLWMVTTGEQNNDEASKLIRTSYDGVNLKGGEGTVTDYVRHLRETEGYDKTAVKQYIEVYCNLLWSEAKGDVPAEELQIHQLSLSPQSVGQWQRYMLETGMRKARGIPDSPVVFATQEKKVIGSNKFGVANFSAR